MVQSIERAFAILEAAAAQPAGVTAIAKRVELPKSTVARLLAALEQRGAVERPDGALFRIGPGVAALAAGASAERSVAAAVRPEPANLVRMVGESAGLAFPDGYEVRYVDQVESDNAIQVRDWTGTRAPLHAAPSGLVLLAHWPPDAIAAYVAPRAGTTDLEDDGRARRAGAAPGAGPSRRHGVGARGVRRGNQLDRRAGA